MKAKASHREVLGFWAPLRFAFRQDEAAQTAGRRVSRVLLAACSGTLKGESLPSCFSSFFFGFCFFLVGSHGHRSNSRTPSEHAIQSNHSNGSLKRLVNSPNPTKLVSQNGLTTATARNRLLLSKPFWDPMLVGLGDFFPPILGGGVFFFFPKALSRVSFLAILRAAIDPDPDPFAEDPAK